MILNFFVILDSSEMRRPRAFPAMVAKHLLVGHPRCQRGSLQVACNHVG